MQGFRLIGSGSGIADLRLSEFHHHVAQFFAGLEEWNSLGGYFDPYPGFGIATDTPLPLPRPESAEASYLNLVTALDRMHHAIEDVFYDNGSFLLRQRRDSGHLVNQICFCQTVPQNHYAVLRNGRPVTA